MNIEAFAADLKRQILNPPADTHDDTAKLIVARWAEYEDRCNEFELLVQDERNDPDKVVRDLLLASADRVLHRVAMPPATTFAEVREGLAFVSHANAAVKRRVTALKLEQSYWARTPLDQRLRQIQLTSFVLYDAPAEVKAALANAAARALAAGYHEPKDVERDKLRVRQLADVTRALNPGMATGTVRQRGTVAAISLRAPPDPRNDRSLPAISNGAIVGTAADAMMRGENVGAAASWPFWTSLQAADSGAGPTKGEGNMDETSKQPINEVARQRMAVR
jgi:hypothetical protein